ncbi:MAG: ABC transporter transmembrane domain-containing protein, partial [Acidimicrobiia bacterium]
MHRRDELWRRLTDHASARQQLARVESRYLPLITTSPLGLQAVVIVAGSALLAGGRIEASTLIGFVALAALFVAPAQGLTAAIRRVQVSRVSVERTFALIDSAPIGEARRVPESPNRSTTSSPSVHIRITDKGGTGASLLVRGGERVAIIGGPGTGKSQLAAALLGVANWSRFAGALSTNGVDWHPPAEVSDLRLLGHDRWFFTGTLRDNLALGRAGVSDADLETALDHAGCSGFLAERGLGLDSQIDEHAAGLSGGEQTRLALARAIAGHPRLVVLDAPSAGLDPNQASQIRSAVMAALPETTVVWLDSQVPDRAAFDHVFTLDGGTLGPGFGRPPSQQHAGHVTPGPPDGGEDPPEALGGEHLGPALPGFGHDEDQHLSSTTAPITVAPATVGAAHFRRSWTALVGLATVETVTVVGIPWALKATLEEAVDRGTSARFMTFAGVAVVASAALLAARIARTRCAARLEERLDRLLKATLVDHIHQAPLRNVGGQPTGELLTSATQDTTSIARLSAQTLPTVGMNALIVVGGFASMFSADAELVGVVAAAFVLLAGFTLFFRRRSELLYGRARAAQAAMTTVVTETIRGHRDITAHRAAGWFAERAAAVSVDLHATWLRAQRLIASYFPAIQLAGNAALVALLALTISSRTPPAQAIPTIAFFITILG